MVLSLLRPIGALKYPQMAWTSDTPEALGTPEARPCQSDTDPGLLAASLFPGCWVQF